MKVLRVTGEAYNEDKGREKKKGRDVVESSLLMERLRDGVARLFNVQNASRRDNVTVVTVRSQVVCSGD